MHKYLLKGFKFLPKDNISTISVPGMGFFHISHEKHCQRKNQGLITKLKFNQVPPKFITLTTFSGEKNPNYLLNTEYFFIPQTRIYATEN